MHWSLLTLTWLLATSVAAIPIKTPGNHGLIPLAETREHGAELALPRCNDPSDESDHEGDTRLCRAPLTNESLVGRDIKKGWFSAAEAVTLQKASETSVNFFNLLDTLSPLTRILDQKRISWAVAGGLALKIHGQPSRYTSDIDIVVQTTMPELKTALGKDKSFILPGPGWPGDAHLRAYHNQGTAAKPKYIEVDLIIAGQYFASRCVNVLSYLFLL